jgi:hypothetical protein
MLVAVDAERTYRICARRVATDLCQRLGIIVQSFVAAAFVAADIVIPFGANGAQRNHRRKRRRSGVPGPLDWSKPISE